MRKVLMVALLCMGSVSFAQIQIKGRVTDTEGNPVSLANITVLNAKQGTAAADNGEFELTVSSVNMVLQITALGYSSKILNVRHQKYLDILLYKSSEKLNDVVVFGRKREETLLTAPIAVSALDALTIENSRTWDLGGLTAIVPNYLYQEAGVAFQAIQSIRGIQVFSENPAVATYIDDVNQLDILSNGFALTDIERIEVLRGPQGTLFGRNAMGGVINIVTKRPTNSTQGILETGFGNLNLQRHALAFRTPVLVDRLFLGFSGLFQKRDGYMENDASLATEPDSSLNGETVGDFSNLYGTMSLKWLVSEKANLSLNVKGQRDRSEASGFFVSQPDEEVAFENPDNIYLSRLARHTRNILNTAFVGKYFSNDHTLTSVTTYQTISLAFEDVDFPGFFHSFVADEIGEKLPPQQVWSQELRIHSTDPDSILNYTAGLFGFTQNTFEPSTNLAQELTDAEADAFGFPLGSNIISRNQGANRGVAVFGELSLHLNRNLIFTGGLRYDYEKRKAIFNGFGDLNFVDGELLETNTDSTEEGDYSAVSPKAALSFAPSENSNLYASYTKGFRAGGINTQRLPEGVAQTFGPEYSNNYEIGYKYNALNKSLRLGVAVFYIDWTDIQFFNLVAPFSFARENLGNGRSTGIEFEATAMPFEGLRFDGSFGYTDTKYREFEILRSDFATGEEIRTDISGNRLANTPRYTLFLSAQYGTSVTKELQGSFRLEMRSIGSYYTDIQNSLQQPTYNLLNTRLTLSYEKYTLSFWGQNLTDKTYLAFGSADTSFGGRSVRTAAPLTFGTSMTYKF